MGLCIHFFAGMLPGHQPQPNRNISDAMQLRTEQCWAEKRCVHIGVIQQTSYLKQGPVNRKISLSSILF